MKTADKMEPIRFGHIQTIEINRERQERVEGSPGLKIGIGVDFRAKHNCDYFLVPPEIYQEIIRSRNTIPSFPLRQLKSIFAGGGRVLSLWAYRYLPAIGLSLTPYRIAMRAIDRGGGD